MICFASLPLGEGFPNVIGEAMSVGIPCVATDIGDSSLVIGDSGWIIPPGDVDSLVKTIKLAMAETVSNRLLRSDLVIDRIRKNYNITSIVEQYREVYFSSD